MTRLCLASAALLAVTSVTAAAAHAQTPAPTTPPAAPATPAAAQQPAPRIFTLSDGLKRSWEGIKRNVSEAAEKMPEEHYSFKPTPEVRSFAGMVGHTVESLHAICLGAKGETVPFKSGSIENLTAKADLVKATQAAIAACDTVYSTATDESLIKLIPVGRNQTTPINLLWGNISHANEHYGNMVTYMRLKGLVPPSTERAQAPRKPASGN